MPITVYHYPKCSTCRKALSWLREHEVDFDAVDIVSAPPSRDALQKIAAKADVPSKKLFNTSGQSYRDGGFKEKLATMSDREMFVALAADGKLIKRPLLVADDFALVGFDAEAYATRFG